MQSNNRKYVLLLRFVFLGISIFILVRIVDFRLVFDQLKDIPWFVIVLLVAIGIFRTWLTGLRWRLLNPDITGQLNSWHYFRFVMLAHTFNLIMPGALGGDFIKTAFTLKTVKHSRIDNVIAILIDRFVGLLSILMLGTAAFIFISEIPDRAAFHTFWGILYGSVFLFIVMMVNSRFHRLLKLYFSRLGKAGAWLNHVISIWEGSLRYFSVNKKKVLLAFLICLPVHIVSFISAFMVARYLNINISFFDITMVIAMVWVVTAIPVTISGAGIREFSMIYLLSLYGVSAESATALSIYIYIISILLGLLGLLFMLDFTSINFKKRVEIDYEN